MSVLTHQSGRKHAAYIPQLCESGFALQWSTLLSRIASHLKELLPVIEINVHVRSDTTWQRALLV